MKNIGIFGVPRSGTSWLAQIYNSHPDVALRFQPLFSYEHKGHLRANSSADEIRTFFKEIFASKDDFALMKSETQKNYPVFHKSEHPTHIIFKETRYLQIIGNMLAQCNEVKIIGIVRNPLAVLASWICAPKEFNSGWDVTKEWRKAQSKNENRPEEYFGFDKWKEFTELCLSLKKQYPQQYYLVRYDDLNTVPFDTTKLLFEYCELDFHPQVKDFLNASRSRHDLDPYSVFRAKANDYNWHNTLPIEIVKQITLELKDTPLYEFLQS